jgi:hypothetical protein
LPMGADNPIGESVYYHDSKKWGVRSAEWRASAPSVRLRAAFATRN